MNLYKRFFGEQALPEPTEEEKIKAEAFKQILKYGTDIGGAYKEACRMVSDACAIKNIAQEAAEKAIIKQRGIKFKNDVRAGNWNGIYIRSYSDCRKSPVGHCVTMHEYGSGNPKRDDPQTCFYCPRIFGGK